MKGFILSVKFLGTHVEFGVDNPTTYKLTSLWADVYISTCSTFPDPTENFKAEVKLPWSGDFKVIKDDAELQEMFNLFAEKNIYTMRIDVDLLPCTILPSVHQFQTASNVYSFSNSNRNASLPLSIGTNIILLSSDKEDEELTQQVPVQSLSSEEDDDYIPQDNNEHSYDVDASVDDETSNDVASHNDCPGFDNESNSHTANNTHDDGLSNAASFKLEQDILWLCNNNEDEVESMPAFTKKGRPFRESESGRIELEVGHLFNNLHHFRQVLRDYVVQEGFQLKRIKNERARYTAECRYEGCTWRIHASPVEDTTTFMIKALQPRHCCQKVHKNHEATAGWVARRYKPLIEENPYIKVKFLGREIQRIYGLSIPSYTLYRAKNMVLNKTTAEQVNSYDRLYSYGYIIRERNPGSMVKLKTITPELGAPSRFQRFFLSFQAQKAGFLSGCRPFIGLDGCHLKGKFPGVLLSAIGMDANFGVFPLAVCICEGENTESWGWFLENLYIHMGLDETRRVTFMSDRQKGVLNAIEKFWPRSSNRFCVRHLTANMQSRFRGQLSGMYVWNAANKANKADFMEEISKLNTVNHDAYNWIMEIPFKHWALWAFDSHVKSAHTTNNISECFNQWVDKYRGQPALTMLESIRRKVMKRMTKRIEEASKWSTDIPPLVSKKLAERQDEARYVTILCASEQEFEVKEVLKYYLINLQTQTCDCGLWDMSGIPCKHAMAVITARRMQGQDFVHHYLRKDAYMRTYCNVIHPIPDQSIWPDVEHNEVLPPLEKRMPGRPKKNRKRGPDEPPKHKRSGGVKCGSCGEFGHNVRTCKLKKMGSTGKEKKGSKTNSVAASKTRFEIGSSSNPASASQAPPAKKRRFEVGDNSNLARASQNPSSHNNGSQHVVSQTSQPLTETTPIQSNGNASQSTTPTNLGTMAGLKIDWSGLF